MADGLLDNLDMLMNRLGPSEEERRRQLRESALTAGIAALGARKGYLAQDLSRAGLLGVADYNQGLRDSGTDKLKRLAIAQQLAQWQAQQQQLQQEREGQTGLTQAMLSAMRGGNASPTAGMPSLAPTVANAAVLEQRQQSAAQPKDPFTAQMERASVLEQEAAKLAAANPNHPALPKIMQTAQKIREDAVKFREKLFKPEVSLRDGKPVLYQASEYGGQPRILEGMQPEPKLRAVPLGGTTQLVNDYNVPATGATYQHTPTQSEITGANRLKWEQDQAKLGAGPGGKQLFDMSNTLRDEFTKAAAPFVTVRDAYRRIQAAGSLGTGPGDISLLFGFMKLNDPTSTVREGEFATAKNAGGVPDWVVAKYNQALNGQLLSGDVRKQLVETSGLLYNKAEQSHKFTEEQYRNLAKRNNIDPENVIVKFNMGDNAAQGKTVVAEGYSKKTGKKYVRYSDGTVEEQ